MHLILAFKEDDKFISSKSCYCISWSNNGFHYLGKLRQDYISSHMAIGIIAHFEIIQIK